MSLLPNANGGISIDDAVVSSLTFERLRSVNDHFVVRNNAFLSRLEAPLLDTFAGLGTDFVVVWNPVLPTCEAEALADQVGRKIDTKSKGRWLRYEKFVGPIEEGLGDVLPYNP